MNRKPFLSVLALSLLFCLPLDDCWARGRGGGGGGRSMGGGGFSGGGGRSMGGGGFSGGGGRSMGGGGFSGGAGRSMGGGGFSGGGGRSMGGGGFSGGGNFHEGAGRSPANFGGSQMQGNRGGLGGNPAAGRSPGNAGGAGFGGQRGGDAGSRAMGGASGMGGRGQSANRSAYSKPDRSQLDGFLGLPSDGGLSGLSGNQHSRDMQKPTGDNFDVNRGTAEGPRGGQAGGVAVTGPRGNTKAGAIGVGADGGVAKVSGVQGAGGGQAARGVAVGPNGGVAAGGAVRGPDGGAAVRGAAVGPDGRVAAGGAVRGPDGGGAARGVVAGPAGAAAGFARVTPSGRYTSAVAVRSNYNHWDLYGPRWHTDHPGAWFAAGWTAATIWQPATWNSVGAWMSYPVATPVYYDYGNSIAYDDGNVYMNGENLGTTQEYFSQASEIAQVGADAAAPDDEQWLPLGVFALTKTDATESSVTIQLAVNKEGIIRGNFTDTVTQKTQLVQGSVDKETQRVVFSVGDDKSNLIETGLYNLTKDEAPALVHVGKDKTEQWLLVRLENKDAAGS